MSIWQEARRRLGGLPDGRGLNIAFEAVDRHVAHGKGDRIAFRFVGRDGVDTEMSYGELARLSNRFANALCGLGIGPGDVVLALMGRRAELYVAAIGCLKARAVFGVLFSAFGPDPIRIRLEKGNARVLVTTADLYRRKVRELRPSLEALRHVVVVDEDENTDDALSWRSLLARGSDRYEIAPTADEDPALLHFTSGTTGPPKGALHVHQAVVAHHETAVAALDLREGDVYWCTADPGWVTGVSYGIVAPLTLGATSVVDDAPFDPERWYRILRDHRVAVWYTAPTAIRMLMKAGTALARRFPCAQLRLIASVGEPLHAEAVTWGEEALGQPIHDTWWQTETGAIMIANRPGTPVRPGAMGRPLPGVDAAVVRRTPGGGIEVVADPEARGELALRAGWPSMFRAYVGDDDRYRRCFAEGHYLSGDIVRRDADGVFWFVGRGDDVIKTAGHLVGPFEIEKVLLGHPAVAEAGAVGLPDPVIGERVKAFVSLKEGFDATDDLGRELLALARKRLGPAIAPREIAFARDLPKTRSGKIMRRLIRARALGLPEGDTSTLEAPGGDAASRIRP